MIPQPITIYNNWSAYDELSDNVELTEDLALKQLTELVRLRSYGVNTDYYLMDAFWFSAEGGYREWRKPHWPQGPARWLDQCRKNGVIPGLWFSGNTLCHLTPVPEWESSLDERIGGMCLFQGGFLRHFMETLQSYYDQGARAYKLDFFRFDAATPEVRRTHLPEEIERMNRAALSSALRTFRERNPEVVFLGYNGLGGDQGGTWKPFRKCVDTKWLEAFDSLYCGDPRPADVPAMNYWRSMDIYSDHMVRHYESNGIPLERIDNTAFMIGTTGTCCKRGTAAWQGMLLLSLARGGWVNIYYGNLELLDAEKARWFAKAQSMFLRLQSLGRTHTFGGVPGEAEPYGYASLGETGALYTVVNPSQSVATVTMPRVSRVQRDLSGGRLLFRDAGFVPELAGDTITLGPEQIALVGFGAYASEEYDLGVQEDVVIPAEISPIAAEFSAEDGAAAATIDPPAGYDLRIVMKQLRADGTTVRTSGGSPPDGTTLGRILTLSCAQGERELPVRIEYDKAIWSGLSWAVGEVSASDIAPGEPVTVGCSSTMPDVRLEAAVYAVRYTP